MSIAEITGSNVRERWVEKVACSIKGSDTPHCRLAEPSQL